jgi:hypothetical protein
LTAGPELAVISDFRLRTTGIPFLVLAGDGGSPGPRPFPLLGSSQAHSKASMRMLSFYMSLQRETRIRTRVCVSAAIPARFKKFCQHATRFLTSNIAGNFDPVVLARVVDDLVDRSGSAGPGVPASKYDPGNPRMHQGARTHRTGLERHIESRPGDPIVAEGRGGLPERSDFSMGGWVRCGDHTIRPPADDSVPGNDDRAYRHFPVHTGLAGQLQSQVHETGVVGIGSICHARGKSPANNRFQMVSSEYTRPLVESTTVSLRNARRT